MATSMAIAMRLMGVVMMRAKAMIMMMVMLAVVQMMTMVKKMAGEKMVMAMTITMAELRGESKEEL